MFSTWWTHSLSSHSQDEDTELPQKSTSFRLPKTSPGDPHTPRRGTLDITNEDTLHTNSISNAQDIVEDDMNSSLSLSGRGGTKEYCKVVNLKIPLPSQNSIHLFKHCYSKQSEQISQPKPKSVQGVESPRLSSSAGFRRKSLGGGVNDQHSKEKQPVLKSVELVNFATEEQPVGNLYMQHQKRLSKSNCIAVPSLAKSSFLVTLAQRPGSASTWKDLHAHPPPSPLHQTPIHNHRTPQPSTECPELVMSSKQLQSPHSVGRLNTHSSLHSMQDYIFRPVFRYSHRGNITQSSPKHCSCIDGCQRCLITNTRMIHPSSLTLDSYKQLQDKLNGNKSTRKLLVKSHGSGASIELPPLDLVSGSGERDLPSLSLQAQGLRIMRHPPKSSSTQTRNERVHLSMASTYRSRRDVSNYSDPLSGGVPSYHRRLSQMAALVSDTVQWEKDKAAKKAKKAASGTGTPRSGNNGSIGSLL